MSDLVPGTAIIRGLRRTGDEPELTRALASVFQAEPGVAGQFVNLASDAVDAPEPIADDVEEAAERYRAEGTPVDAPEPIADDVEDSG